MFKEGRIGPALHIVFIPGTKVIKQLLFQILLYVVATDKRKQGSLCALALEASAQK